MSIKPIYCLALLVSLASVTCCADAAASEKLITDIQVGTAHDALFGISFAGDQGAAVGVAGSIFETADSGKTWKSVTEAPIPASLLAVDWHGKFAIAVGQAGLIMVRVEGAGWKRSNTGDDHRLFSVSVNKFGTAVATGEFGTVLKTTDGGVTWTSIAPKWSSLVKFEGGGGADPHMYSALIDEAGVITIGGEFGTIMKTADGGKTWTALNGPNEKSPSIFAVYLAPPGGGNSYAVGQSGHILVSANGGASWQPSATSTQSNFLGVTVSGSGKVVVTGMRVMVISSDSGKTWTPVEEGDTTTDWYQSVRTESKSGRAIAVGHSGKIIAIGS
ncbi:MAG: oxidoreductase [Nevskia sp.]